MVGCEPYTSRERLLFKLCYRLDEAFRHDSSIGAINRAYRKLRTGQPEIDRELRDHIGLLYLFERVKPALLRAARKGDVAAKGHESRSPTWQVVDVMDRFTANTASESERSRVEV